MPSLADTLDRVPTWTPIVGPAARAGETVSNLYDQVSSGDQLDIPTATGEDEWFDTAYDTGVEQPSNVEDDEDVTGPSLGEITDATGITDSLDPTSGDDTGLSSPGVIRAVFAGAAVLAGIVAIGQLFTINVGDADA